MRYNAQSKFGLYLIYGHLKVQRDMIMLGTTFAQLSGYWTKPTSVQDINPEDIIIADCAYCRFLKTVIRRKVSMTNIGIAACRSLILMGKVIENEHLRKLFEGEPS